MRGPVDVSDREHESQSGDWPNTGLSHQQSCIAGVFCGRCDGLVQLPHLPFEHVEQLDQIMTALTGAWMQGQSRQCDASLPGPELCFLLDALVQHQMLQLILHPGRDLDQLVPVQKELPQGPGLLTGNPGARETCPLSIEARCVPHRVGLSFAYGHSWSESGPHLQPILHGLFAPENQPVAISNRLDSNEGGVVSSR